MKMRPYTNLQKFLEAAAFILLLIAYLFVFILGYQENNNVFTLLLMTFVYIILLIFGMYPQITNIVTAKNYNENTKERRERNTRYFILGMKIVILIFNFLSVIYVI